MNLVVTFHVLDPGGYALDNAQFHDVPILPVIGELCRIVTTRDRNGNYSSDGEPQQRWAGTVLWREFRYEIQGNNPASRRSTVYVDIYLQRAEAAKQ